MRKRRRVRMSTVDSFLSEKGIRVVRENLRTDLPFYGAIEVDAITNTNKSVARVTALARVGGEDINRQKRDIALMVADARAKRGLYALLHGRKIHDPLCQGVRL
jgi:hypothetical protein